MHVSSFVDHLAMIQTTENARKRMKYYRLLDVLFNSEVHYFWAISNKKERKFPIFLSHFSIAMVRVFVSPPNSHSLKFYSPKIVVLVGGAVGRYLDHQGEALMNEISAFVKEDPERSLTPSAKWGNSERRCQLWSRRRALTPPRWHPAFQTPELWVINF